MDERSSPESDAIPEELAEFVKPELDPGERLLWASRPGLRFRNAARSFHPGPMVWAAGLLILCVGCLAGNQALMGPRFEGLAIFLLTTGWISGVVSFLVVLGSIASFVSPDPDRSGLAGQVYALTDRRAIIQITDPKTQAVTVHSHHRGTIKGEQLHRVQYPDGSGDVLFETGYGQPAGFKDVAEVRRVEALIRRFLIVPDDTSTA